MIDDTLWVISAFLEAKRINKTNEFHVAHNSIVLVFDLTNKWMTPLFPLFVVKHSGPNNAGRILICTFLSARSAVPFYSKWVPQTFHVAEFPGEHNGTSHCEIGCTSCKKVNAPGLKPIIPDSTLAECLNTFSSWMQITLRVLADSAAFCR